MPDCFFIKTKLAAGFGGNVAFSSEIGRGKRRIIVRRNAAIGDSICASAVADRLVRHGYSVTWQTHPMIQNIMRRHPRITDVVSPSGHYDVNLDNAYEKDPNRATRHFHDMFFGVAGRQLLPLGIQLGSPTNCRPRLGTRGDAMAAVISRLSVHSKPWVFICPRSNSYASRTISDGVWLGACKEMAGTKFWLGNHGPAPEGIVDLKTGSIDQTADYLAAADLLVTVDTGPMHIAAAINIPVIAIEQSSSPRLHLTDQTDYSVVSPALSCLNCQQWKCPINEWHPPCQDPDPMAIAEAVGRRLAGLGKVSCVIPTHNQTSRILNRCLEAVVSQVDEVIVTRGMDGQVPADVFKHEKIRHIIAPGSRIGFGKNVNFGVRHSHGEFVLILNDDCYLEHDAVSHLIEHMKDPKVGVVGHFLKYPDGRICHGGKFRKKGMRGWGLTDNRMFHPSIKEPVQMENVTGTSILVRRLAFYDVHGFDEDFFLYAEDDALCMQMGARGWKIMYTPFAKGIHEEAATTRRTAKGGDIMRDYVHASNRLFEDKWGWWLTKNVNTIPGVFS
jgi:GT2 family glycosyltransferase